MTSKITEFREIITVLKSLPEDILQDVETDPEKIDAYCLLMDDLQKAAMRCFFAFPKIKAALDIKYNSGGATY